MFPRLTSPRSRAWLAWAVILPALALRALVPAGFMPMRDAQGHLALMICPGEAPGLPLASPDPHAHHHHHSESGGAPGSDPASAHEHGGAAGHIPCPFALSAGPALAHALVAQAPPPAGVDYLPRAEYSDPRVEPLRRAQAARAPPAPHRV